MNQPFVTGVRTFDNSPVPLRHGLPMPITYDEMARLAITEAEHQQIWRDDLSRRAAEPENAAQAVEMEAAAAARDRQAQVFTKMAKLVEYCADPQIMRRLREIKQAEAEIDAR